MTFVGKVFEVAKGQSGRQGKAKGKAKAKERPELEAVAAATLQAAETPAPSTSNSRGLQTAKSEKKVSCVDAAANFAPGGLDPLSAGEVTVLCGVGSASPALVAPSAQSLIAPARRLEPPGLP